MGKTDAATIPHSVRWILRHQARGVAPESASALGVVACEILSFMYHGPHHVPFTESGLRGADFADPGRVAVGVDDGRGIGTYDNDTLARFVLACDHCGVVGRMSGRARGYLTLEFYDCAAGLWVVDRPPSLDNLRSHLRARFGGVRLGNVEGER